MDVRWSRIAAGMSLHPAALVPFSSLRRPLLLLLILAVLPLVGCDELELPSSEAPNGEMDDHDDQEGGSARKDANDVVRPNEPAGLNPWFDHDWETFPESVEIGLPMAASGAGYFHGSGNFGGFGNVELIDDRDADHGFGKSLRVRLREGHQYGTGVFNWSVASSPEALSHEDHVDLEEIYISVWIYFERHPEDGTWEIPNAAWRTFSINRHVSHDCDGGAVMGLSQRGARGYQPSFRSWWFWGHPGCDVDGGAQTIQDVTPGPELDTWHHLEIHLKRLDTAHGWPSDGESRLRFWVNGEPLVDRTVTHAWPAPARQLHVNLNPSGSWHQGAQGKTRDDYFRISGLYVSGTPYRGR